MMLCFQNELHAEWPRIAKCIKEMGGKMMGENSNCNSKSVLKLANACI